MVFVNPFPRNRHYAHNIKIITLDGHVILMGPVRSKKERKVVENMAIDVAHLENVTSGLKVATREAGR
ncbi:MAG: BON domain-containing protein [Chitinophagaceae bacterium]|nr:BON domain-containing protein [Oligoflexus sp.]